MKHLPYFISLLCLSWANSLFAIEYTLPDEGNDLIGRLQQSETRYEDTFSDIARQHDLGYREMVAANPEVDPWLPGKGTEVVLPSQFILPPGPRKGIVINLPELRIYFYSKDGKTVTTHPLGIGRDGWNTPVGRAKVTRKKVGPTWTPPDSIRAEHAAKGDILPPIVEAGPDNPLGSHAIYLSLPGNYLLHGTNKPFGVGMRVSHGCIRLYPEDIASIFPKIPVGSPVAIINEPYKAGWLDGQLYVEAHPPLVDGVDDEGQIQTKKVNITPMMRAVVAALGDDDHVDIDWASLKNITQNALGFPIPIGEKIIEPTIIDSSKAQASEEDKGGLSSTIEPANPLSSATVQNNHEPSINARPTDTATLLYKESLPQNTQTRPRLVIPAPIILDDEVSTQSQEDDQAETLRDLEFINIPSPNSGYTNK